MVQVGAVYGKIALCMHKQHEYVVRVVTSEKQNGIESIKKIYKKGKWDQKEGVRTS